LIKPLDLTAELLDKAGNSTGHWWLGNSKEAQDDTNNKTWVKPRDFKEESTIQNDIMDLAKKQHMSTDIKKAVFQAILSSDDYIQAFENVIRLNLKKQ
jgi:nucleolar MIF4G domain-containing protein 1